jgi:hypothetical protein
MHLGGDDGVVAGTGGDHDAGVVDDAAPAGAVHEARRLEQEVLGLEAGEARNMCCSTYSPICCARIYVVVPSWI